LCEGWKQNNKKWPVKPRAELLGFTQTVGIVTAVLSLARVGLPRCKLLFFLAQFTSFDALSFSSTPLLWSLRVVKRSYKLSKPSGTTCSFRRKLRQLTKLLVRINLHRGYPSITQLVFWSSAERDSTVGYKRVPLGCPEL
jgi:hypothetical protein